MIARFDAGQVQTARELARHKRGRAHLQKMLAGFEHHRKLIEDMLALGIDRPEYLAELDAVKANIEIVKRALGSVRA